MKLVLFILLMISSLTALLSFFVPSAKRDRLEYAYIEIIPREPTSRPTSSPHGAHGHEGHGDHESHKDHETSVQTPQKQFQQMDPERQLEFRTWIPKVSTNEEVQATLAIAFFSLFAKDKGQRNPQQSKKNLDSVLEKEPLNPMAWRLLGYFHISNGFQLTEAVQCYQKAIEIQPNYGDAHYALSFALTTNNLELGETHFRRALELGITDERGLAEKYYTQVDMKAYQKATPPALSPQDLTPARLKEYQERIEPLSDPELKEALKIAYLHLFMADRSRRNLPLAQEKLNVVFQKEPENVVAWRLKGYLAISQGFRWEEALECYQKAVSIDPQYGEVHYALAFTVVADENLRQTLGEKHFKEALRLGIEDERNIAQYYPQVSVPSTTTPPEIKKE
jgi:tetratricopeptide (TPR) repeat protein